MRNLDKMKKRIKKDINEEFKLQSDEKEFLVDQIILYVCTYGCTVGFAYNAVICKYMK